MSEDYSDLLNMTWDDIPKEQVLPNGPWLLAGKNVAFVRPRKEDQSPKVLFTYKAKEPSPEVNQDELEEMVGSGYDFTINDLNMTFYIESPKDWDKVRVHLEKHGLSLSGRLFDSNGKLSFARDFRGAEVVADLEQRNWEDDAHQIHWENKLTNFRPVEE